MRQSVFDIFHEFIMSDWLQDADGNFKQSELSQSSGRVEKDRQFFMSISKALKNLSTPSEKTIFTFGQLCFPILASRMFHHVSQYRHPKAFLMSLDPVIKNQIKKIFPNAMLPDIECQDTAEDELVIIYKSKRKLHTLFEGLLAGVSTYFGTKMDVEKTKVNNKTEELWEFKIKFQN